MDTKHTPGPWIIGDAKRRDPHCIIIHTPEGESIASVWHLMMPDGTTPFTPLEANARLIAAAPDLLAALEGMWEWQRSVRELLPDELSDRVHTAISKARGLS